jgi:uncharacterized membrane protein
MPRLDWLQLFQEPMDMWGFALYILVFPVYHGIYPIVLMRLFPRQAARTRFDRFRSSWIEGILDRKDYLLAAQQTRNLTMVNTLLASSSLLLIGFSANVLIELGRSDPDEVLRGAWGAHPEAEGSKLLLLMLVFGVAFAYCMTSLRHLGHFTLVIGAQREVIEEYEGSAVDYLANLINQASNRHTLAVRCLFSATPVFLWLFDTRLFVALTLVWGFKFMILQDFKGRPAPGAHPDGSRPVP